MSQRCFSAKVLKFLSNLPIFTTFNKNDHKKTAIKQVLVKKIR